MSKLKVIAWVREVYPVLRDGKEVLFPSQALTLSQLKKLAPELARKYRVQRNAIRRAEEETRREREKVLPPARITLRGGRQDSFGQRVLARVKRFFTRRQA